MYVCLCNALTDEDVCRARAAGACRPAEILAACNCRAQCGTCARTLRDIARAHAHELADAAD
ncbi:MAG: (2Fe-2S)-binding protein [Proteobacteria bacterium]|nr:(2Fe-2S)-binding protein [Pseudomonadota bacterium]